MIPDAPKNGGLATAYPARSAFFAHRYCRKLTKTCAAQELGHIGLLS